MYIVRTAYSIHLSSFTTKFVFILQVTSLALKKKHQSLSSMAPQRLEFSLSFYQALPYYQNPINLTLQLKNEDL